MMHITIYRLAALAAGLALSASAQASFNATTAVSNLRLTITDANGTVQSLPGGLMPSGEIGWQPVSGILVGPYVDDRTAWDSTTSPVSEGQAPSSQSLSWRDGTMSLTTSSSDLGLSLTTEFTSAPATFFAPETGQARSFYSRVGWFPSVGFDAQTEEQATELAAKPIQGGFWLAPGSSATLMADLVVDATWRLDDMLVDPNKVTGSASVDVVISMLKARPGDSLDSATLTSGNDVSQESFWFEYVDEARPAASFVKSTQTTDVLSITFENTSTEGQWLLPAVNTSIVWETIVAPVTGVVPEPGTWALFGLGLLGLSAAVRQQRQRTLS